MAIKSKVSSGTLFVKFTAIGLIALFASIIFLKYTDAAGAYTAIALGAFIFSINLFAVLGYTRAVLANPDVLAESDSPDLAYYLGFCLTVGALSATFITDTIISQFVSVNASQGVAAAAQSDLIKGSLVQFGVGLTATLIGLCAKVYLASKQSEDTLELEEFYRRFRMEIQSFQYEMQAVTTSYTQTLNNNMTHINGAMEETRDSFKELTEVAKQSSAIISAKLGDDSIGQPITEFAASVQSFNASAKGLAASSKESENTFKEISSSLKDFSKSLAEVDNSTKNLVTDTTQLSISTQDLIDANNSANKAQNNLTSGIAAFGNNMQSATERTSSLSSSMSSLNETIDKSQQDLVNFTGAFNALANSFNSMSNQVGAFDSALQKSSANLNLNADTGRTFMNEVQNLQSGIGKLTSELSTLESRLKRLNQIN